MIKIISFFKNLSVENIALFGAMAFILLQAIFIYILQSDLENKEAKIAELEFDKMQMSDFIKTQQNAISELEANFNEKEALSCEITAQKQKIINVSRETKKEQNDQMGNSVINSAVSFVVTRLREQNATK